MKPTLYLIILFVIFSQALYAQITSSSASGNATTQYTSFSEVDDIFVFCNSDSISQSGSLTVTTSMQGTKTFKWEKYNETSATYDLYSSDASEDLSSTISGLADGCYRATVTKVDTTKEYRAWVFNNWIIADAEIKESKCDYFVMSSNFRNASFVYYDLLTNDAITLNNDIQLEWTKGGSAVATISNPTIYDPPTSNTTYSLRVYDDFGCEATASVLYESIVTKAVFSATPTSGEAPLEVTFSNSSENATSGTYQWFFYYSLGDIAEQAESGASEIDSIDFVAYDDAPTYTYENTGDYMVKLVSAHVSDSLTCTDTAYLSDYIEVDSSYIKAPNVFTPNGDGTNDEFVIKFWSMQSLDINIYNRWGRRVHSWKSGDIAGFEDTMERSVWNGKINGRYASPGVYFYDAVGRGRDGVKHEAHGFVHLFRGKD